MLGIITDMRIAVRHMSCSMAKLLESASEILKRHGVRRAVLFGSQAAGKAKSGSDMAERGAFGIGMVRYPR